jgi:hypothetical protein
MERIWKNKLTMEIKVFVWLVCQDRIQSGLALERMN